MSGSGAPEQSAPHARGMRVTVVAAQWHERVMEGLVTGALRAIEEAGAQESVVRAAGSFELPVLAAAARGAVPRRSSRWASSSAAAPRTSITCAGPRPTG